jgi:hypothetical protein
MAESSKSPVEKKAWLQLVESWQHMIRPSEKSCVADIDYRVDGSAGGRHGDLTGR